jgi:S1/P1 Nuclease
MPKSFLTLAVVTLAFLVLTPLPSYGWNRTGHRAIALIAYRQLDDGTRQKVAALLRKNPAAYDLWTGKKINSDTDPAADAFMQASTFADDVRPPSRFSQEFHHPTHHYVTFRFSTKDDGKREGDPLEEENLLTTYLANMATVKSHQPGVTDAKKALALCWIFHQEGDIHQPLHAISRYSNAFPEGDRGGNLVHPFPNPRGSRPYSKNLHAYWDDMLGDDDVVKTFDALSERVEVVLSEFPRAKFSKAELDVDDVRVWARESVDAGRDTAYRDLDPEVASYDELPVAYEAEAQKLARRRMALAGYRLAEVLNDLFGDAND